jgi:hypothetical protein
VLSLLRMVCVSVCMTVSVSVSVSVIMLRVCMGVSLIPASTCRGHCDQSPS